MAHKKANHPAPPTNPRAVGNRPAVVSHRRRGPAAVWWLRYARIRIVEPRRLQFCSNRRSDEVKGGKAADPRSPEILGMTTSPFLVGLFSGSPIKTFSLTSAHPCHQEDPHPISRRRNYLAHRSPEVDQRASIHRVQRNRQDSIMDGKVGWNSPSLFSFNPSSVFWKAPFSFVRSRMDSCSDFG